MMMMMIYYLRGILKEIEVADYIFDNTDNIYNSPTRETNSREKALIFADYFSLLLSTNCAEYVREFECAKLYHRRFLVHEDSDSLFVGSM